MAIANIDVKGEYIIVLKRFIDESFDESDRALIYAQLPPELGAVLPTAMRTDWLPLPLATRLFRGIDIVCADALKTQETIIAFGRMLAGDAMRTYMKLLFKILTPRLLTTKFPDAYTRYYRNGKLVADVSEIGKNRIAFETEGHDYLQHLATGWIYFVYEQLGMKNLKVTTNVPLGQANIPGNMIWSVSWD